MGFRYILAGLLAIALVFAGLSLWPYAAGMLGASSSQAAPTAAAAAAPLALPPAVSPPALPPPAAGQPTFVFAEEREQPPEQRSWLYTQRSAILRVEPGGTGHRAPTVSTAPVTILIGTRLWPLRTEAEWVMVRSPSGLLGWVHTSEVDTSIPYFKRRY